MREFFLSLELFVLMIGASWAGLFLQRWMREHHRSRDTIDSARLVITMLVTFAAIVLGLLVTAVKSNFDSQSQAVRHLGTRLISLDTQLREYGAPGAPIRSLIRAYTAAAIADTWPNEKAPPGDYPRHLRAATPDTIESTTLDSLLMRADAAVQRLPPGTIEDQIRSAMRAVEQARWSVIEQAVPTISRPFVTLLMFWLVVIFLVFGLTSPRNGVILAVMLVSAVSLASALYLVLDLDSPFGGFLNLSSRPLRDALAYMDRLAG